MAWIPMPTNDAAKLDTTLRELRSLVETIDRVKLPIANEVVKLLNQLQDKTLELICDSEQVSGILMVDSKSLQEIHQLLGKAIFKCKEAVKEINF